MEGTDGSHDKKAPASLWFAAAIAILMGAVYLFRMFSYMSDSMDEQDHMRSIVITFFVVLYFLMFVKLLTSVFGLPSGNRRSWRATVRMGIAYIATTAVCYMGIEFLANDVTVGMVTIPSWAMSVVMAALVFYMFGKEVRDFFTPSYADPVGALEWFFYIIGMDPFRGSRFTI